MTARPWPLLILLAVTVLGVFAVLWPLTALFAAQHDELASTQGDIAHYRAQIARRPALEAELKNLKAQAAPSEALLSGANTALAAAAMQGEVKALVERHGGQLRSAQNIGSSVSDGLEKIVIQYDVTLTPASLKGAIYDLETRAPYLFVEQADIAPELSGDGATAPATLRVQWTIHGYRRVGAR